MTANRMFSIITFGLSKYSIKLGLIRLSGTLNSKPVMMIITIYNYWKAEDILFTSTHMILSHDCNTLKTSELRLFHLQIYSWGLSQHLPAYPRFGPKLSNTRHCAPPSAQVKIQHTAPCMRRISVVWKRFSTPAIVSKGVTQSVWSSIPWLPFQWTAHFSATQSSSIRGANSMQIVKFSTLIPKK